VCLPVNVFLFQKKIQDLKATISAQNAALKAKDVVLDSALKDKEMALDAAVKANAALETMDAALEAKDAALETMDAALVAKDVALVAMDAVLQAKNALITSLQEKQYPGLMHKYIPLEALSDSCLKRNMHGQ
jgi:hypothetical protein